MTKSKIKNKKIVIILVIFGVLFLILLLRIFTSNSLPRLTRVFHSENTTPCTQSNNKDQIYYGGNGADYISDSNGKSFSKVWDKNGIGVAFGVPSPDGSKIAYVEDDGLWIRCTANAGQIKIDFPHKIIGESDYPPRLLIKGVHWSPDSQKLALSYAGDVITVDVKTKQKEVLVKDAAFKIFQLKSTTSPYSGSGSVSPWYYAFNQGVTFWATNGDIFYTKFIDSQKTELHRILGSSEKDELIITGDFPIDINNVSFDQKYILLSEDIWKDQINENPPYKPNYAINLSNKQIVYDLYNQSLINTSGGILPKKVIWSKDGRFVYIGDDGSSVDNYNSSPVFNNNVTKMSVIDVQTGKNKEINQLVKEYLQSHGLMSGDKSFSLEFHGFSDNNTMMICVNCENYSTERQVLLMDQNGNISEIYRDSDTKRGTPAYLWPKSWL